MTAPWGLVNVERVVELARKVPVFPCGSDKRPLVKSGFHAASQDEAQIRAWWNKWPEAIVGVPTGQATGFLVIDYDPDKATSATHTWMAEKAELLVKTRVHTTGRNGKHYLFKTKDRYQTGTDLVLDGSPRKGIDLRASGGYVIWWPFCGYNVTGEEIADLPAGLIDERRFRPERDMAPLPSSAPEAWAIESPKVAAALKYLAPEGYDRWIKVGMAIHDASGGSDEGFALWHEWSATGDSYDGIEDCRYHWASFGRYEGRRIGLGSLFAAAMEAGYLPATGEPIAGTVPSKQKGPIAFRHIAEIVAEKREAAWLLHKVLEANVLGVLAGPRGSFKSFVALDWGMRIAQAGRPVLMLSGEGAGLDRRADAWMRTHGQGSGIADFPLFALERPVNLRLAVELEQVAAAVGEMPEPPALIVVDTFSKFSAGIDENDNGEVAAFLAGLTDCLRLRYECSVLVVAHSGHGDAKRPRGASALMANPDAEYIIDRPPPPAMNVTVSRERFKDSPALPALAYEAIPVDLGRFDAYGEPVTSLALISSQAPPAAAREVTGKVQRQLLAGLRNLQRDSKTRLFWSVGELRAVARSGGARKQSAASAVDALVMSGLLVPVGGGGYSFPVDNS